MLCCEPFVTQCGLQVHLVTLQDSAIEHVTHPVRNPASKHPVLSEMALDSPHFMVGTSSISKNVKGQRH